MSWTARNGYLTAAETAGNAQEVANFFLAQGWSKNAISAMIGNMQGESGVNPGIWEELRPYWRGYGLTQWSPYTKLSDWADNLGYTWLDNGPTQCKRIDWESLNNEQWFRNDQIGVDPPISFTEFSVSNLPLNTLTNYFLWFYEHPVDPGPTTQAIRQGYAQNWYDTLDWTGGGSLPVWMLFKFRRWINA